MASGIHLLVHHRREYPLVERLGQAVATGSHTFIALSEIKVRHNPNLMVTASHTFIALSGIKVRHNPNPMATSATRLLPSRSLRLDITLTQWQDKFGKKIMVHRYKQKYTPDFIDLPKFSFRVQERSGGLKIESERRLYSAVAPFDST